MEPDIWLKARPSAFFIWLLSRPIIRAAMAAAPKVLAVPTLSHPGGNPPLLSDAMILAVRLSPESRDVINFLPEILYASPIVTAVITVVPLICAGTDLPSTSGPSASKSKERAITLLARAAL